MFAKNQAALNWFVSFCKKEYSFNLCFVKLIHSWDKIIDFELEFCLPDNLSYLKHFIIKNEHR